MSTTLWFLFAASGVSMPPTVLYCVGHDAHSTVLTLDFAHNQASAMTLSGRAIGSLRTTEQYYLGKLQSTGGQLYWFSVDRFSGEFALAIPGETQDEIAQAEFIGKCTPRTQQF